MLRTVNSNIISIITAFVVLILTIYSTYYFSFVYTSPVTVYGTVSDYITTDPVKGVKVIISKHECLTGDDGIFFFNKLIPVGVYSIIAQKNGYEDYKGKVIIEVKDSKVKKIIRIKQKDIDKLVSTNAIATAIKNISEKNSSEAIISAAKKIQDASRVLFDIHPLSIYFLINSFDNSIISYEKRYIKYKKYIDDLVHKKLITIQIINDSVFGKGVKLLHTKSGKYFIDKLGIY